MDVQPKRPKRGRVPRGRLAVVGLVVYMTKGNPECERLEQFLVAAGIPYVQRDVFADMEAMEEVAERTRGRVRLPAVGIGEMLLESQTPGSLSRFLRRRTSRSL